MAGSAPPATDMESMIQRSIAAALAPLNKKLDTVTKDLQDMKSDQSQQVTETSEKAKIIREQRAKATEAIRLALEAQDISYTDDDLNLSNQKEKMKKEDLGEFDGSDLFTFKAEIDSALSIFSTEAVARMMARNLTGQAHTWWISLDSVIRDGLLTDADVFYTKLNDEFSKNKGVLRNEARNRRWKVGKESVMDYYYDKLKLITNSFGTTDQNDLCHEIREGLPDDFKVLIRTTLARHAKTEALRNELNSLETDYMELRKRPNPYYSSPPYQRNQQMPLSAPGPSWGPAIKREAPRSLRESYNPKNISYSADPKNPSKRVRTYLVPDGSGRIIYLNRPCATCGQDHFNFEHPNASMAFEDEGHTYPLHNVGDGEFLFSAMDWSESSYPSPNSSPESFARIAKGRKRAGSNLYSAHEPSRDHLEQHVTFDLDDEEDNFSYYQTKLIEYQENQ